MKHIALILACLMLTSCGVFKSTFKHKTVQSEVTKTDVHDTGEKSETKMDKSTSKTVTSTKTIEELPDIKVSGTKKTDKKELQEGVDVIDSAGISVKVFLDSASNLLKVMAGVIGGKKVTEQLKEEIKNNDISEKSDSKSQHQENKQVAVESKDKTVEKEPIKMGVLALIVLGSVLIISFFVWLYFRVKKPKI